jgi:hypothetical protein
MRMCLVFFIVVYANQIYSQIENKSYSIISVAEKIKVDGFADEVGWKSANLADGFRLQSPLDGQAASLKTEVRLLRSQSSIYVFATMYGSNRRIIQTLKRDNFEGSDAFAILFDPVGERASGFGFGVNIANAQTEVIVLPDDVDSGWDCKWYSATQNYEDRWTVEIEIPLKSLRFKKSKNQWNINFARVVPAINEVHTWTDVPRQFEFTDLGFYGTMIWDGAPTNNGKNIAFLPYATSSIAKGDKKLNTDLGAEIKIGLTSSLNLDLTYNPDFSQTDVDEQVTNLTRFDIFFPERRQFFLENNDIFSGFGLNDEQVFYSRRIGLDEAGNKVPIVYGARVSGNVANKTRVGAFNILTDKNGNGAGSNYSALAVQQRFLKRSAIKGILLNRQAKGDDYGRNAGLDLNLTSNDGTISAYGGLLSSYKAQVNDKNFQQYGGIDYAGKNFRGFVELQKVGRNFYSDMGFNNRLENFDSGTQSVTRIGYTNLGSMLNYNIFPKKSKSVNSHISGVENYIWWNEGTGFNEYYNRIRHFILFKNRTELKFRFNNHIVNLLYPFTIGNYDIPRAKYNMQEFNTQFVSDNTKAIVFDAFAVYGEFYGGHKLTMRGGIKYRLQPKLNVRLGVDQNAIKFPGDNNVKLTLFTNQIEYNFSNKLFWTTFVQYSTQQQNFAVNTRIQYRYRPMSDIFIVINENDDITLGKNLNRAITLKVNYWLGL